MRKGHQGGGSDDPYVAPKRFFLTVVTAELHVDYLL